MQLVLSPEGYEPDPSELAELQSRLMSDALVELMEPYIFWPPASDELEELAAWLALHLDLNWILHPLAREIVTRRLAAQTGESWRNLAAFLDECEMPGMRNLITEAVAEDRKFQNPDQQLADVVKTLRNQFLDRQITSCVQRASSPDIADVERMDLLRHQQELRQQKQQPLIVRG